ncbi:MAG TPA: DEAD/DEAH box helicase [Bacteroidia bacterium]|nr:DEAD/DEAH box helicase [Bacteroidia bacterium]MBP7714429.1 DEAD/DEAH box helicase [Bacteroidia bacterium]MBP8668550.1 DEAD/DEAH box helicase [Bacteroidia bacterium]HOZ83600.1 DEAD/DEAH box helicase [Bacteroidia bacterium]HQW17712.1 DEAD/DEAH box helicase [Bacteroidia bacterium]
MSTSIGFDSLKLNRQLLNAIGELGYETPTEIQQKVIPPALSGQNIIGIAQTGTGKTAAFILPLLRTLNYAQGNEPRALILAPTRELVIQIGAVANQMGKYVDLRIVTVYGGKGFSDQKKKLEAGCDIVVATPAQAMELYLSGHLILKKIKHFVMDEAERLMDFGFTGQIYSLLEVLPRKRQNMLFSATFSERVKKISDDFMEFPVFIDVVPQVKTAAKIEQYLYTVNSFQTKLNLLNFLLSDKENFNKVIIFCKSKKNANRIAEVIQMNYGADGINVLHGDKTQQTRLNAINRFREEEIRLLIATDVAARGIDVPGVSHVINFDVPLVYEDYIHRIGRTGRAFASGLSITFVEPQDEWHIKKIQKLAGISIKRLNIPESVEVIQPGREETQLRDMEIDRQKRKDNPEFKGAFHERKNKSGKKGRHAGRK